MPRLPVSPMTKFLREMVSDKSQSVKSTVKAVHDMQQLKNRYLYDAEFAARSQRFMDIKMYSRQKYHEETAEDNNQVTRDNAPPAMNFGKYWPVPAGRRRRNH